MRVGVAGLGVMGAAVAARLMEVGHEVTVWNRTPEKTKASADTGAKVAATPAQLASAVEATITMLTDAAAIDDEVLVAERHLGPNDVRRARALHVRAVALVQVLAELDRRDGAVVVVVGESP